MICTIKRNRKTVCITGASGLLGASLTRKFSKEGYRVHALSRQNRKSTKKVIWFQADIHKDIPQAFFSRSSLLIHCAGSAKKNCLKINYHGTKKLLKKAKEGTIKKLIYISSCAVYDFSSEKKTIKTKSKKNNLNSYSNSKLLAEAYVKRECKKMGIPFIILRPATIVSNFKKNKLFVLKTLLSSRQTLFSFLLHEIYFFITDLNRITKAIYNHKKLKPNSTYNICDSIPWTQQNNNKHIIAGLFKNMVRNNLLLLRRKVGRLKIFKKHPIFFALFCPQKIHSITDKK
ncbi:MAG: NAD(P)-dependent oxidoreductase [Chlamydiae bacterium]|nr:NAD(P)-dependent oxidoreductase [Chlamydiota bacterium]